jgi:hypothetical protein
MVGLSVKDREDIVVYPGDRIYEIVNASAESTLALLCRRSALGHLTR